MAARVFLQVLSPFLQPSQPDLALNPHVLLTLPPAPFSRPAAGCQAPPRPTGRGRNCGSAGSSAGS